MKIQLIEQGYDSLNGYFGTVLFENGISVSDVSDAEARFFASILQVRCFDDGSDPGANAQYQSALLMEAKTVNMPTQAELDALARDSQPQQEPEVKKEESTVAYTREQLEEIADKSGIGGLREIGDKFNVKATSITKLISAILDAQAMKPVVVTPEETASE